MNDLISRKAVLNLRKYNLVGGIHTVNVADIEKLPTIPQVVCDDDCEHCSWTECPLPQKTEERPTAEFVKDGFGNIWCENCMDRADKHNNYCPNCGAKMQESEEEE